MPNGSTIHGHVHHAHAPAAVKPVQAEMRLQLSDAAQCRRPGDVQTDRRPRDPAELGGGDEELQRRQVEVDAGRARSHLSSRTPSTLRPYMAFWITRSW